MSVGLVTQEGVNNGNVLWQAMANQICAICIWEPSASVSTHRIGLMISQISATLEMPVMVIFQ